MSNPTYTIHTTPEGFDPSNSLSHEQYAVSIANYQAQIDDAIRARYPDIEVIHRDDDGNSLLRGWPDDASYYEVDGDLDNICEQVWDCQDFWV